MTITKSIICRFIYIKFTQPKIKYIEIQSLENKHVIHAKDNNYFRLKLTFMKLNFVEKN